MSENLVHGSLRTDLLVLLLCTVGLISLGCLALVLISLWTNNLLYGPATRSCAKPR